MGFSLNHQNQLTRQVPPITNQRRPNANEVLAAGNFGRWQAGRSIAFALFRCGCRAGGLLEFFGGTSHQIRQAQPAHPYQRHNDEIQRHCRRGDVMELETQPVPKCTLKANRSTGSDAYQTVPGEIVLMFPTVGRGSPCLGDFPGEKLFGSLF